MLTKTSAVQTRLAAAQPSPVREDVARVDEGTGEAVMDVLFSGLLVLTFVTGGCFLFYAGLLVHTIMQAH